METKWCSGCGKTLSVAEFSKDSRRYMGLAARCKACDSKKNARYRQRLAAESGPAAVTKHCAACSRDLPGSDYNIDRTRPDGLQSTCKACKRARRRAYLYGISVEDQQKMWDDQEGRCAICNAELGDNYHFDHCHATSRARGLLCGPCNQGLGSFQDSISLLRRAIEYLG